MFIVKELKDTWVIIGEFKTEQEAKMFKLAHKRCSSNPTRIYNEEGEEVI